MKKELFLIEAINITGFYNNMSEEKRNALPLKVYYGLKKVVNKLHSDVSQFEEFRNDEIKKIRDIYFSDEKSEETDVPKVDENGEPVLDNDGSQVTEVGRKIKDEYIDEYKIAMDTLNEKLQEIVMEKNTYEYNWVDIAGMVENLPDDTPLTKDDIDILDAIFDETND